VIENGPEFFNRSLYGGNTAFRVDGGDKPEFVMYLPGRGGNLRLGFRSPSGAKWLHQAERILTRYRPGELLYEVRDPLLGEKGVLHVEALAYEQTEGLIVRTTAVDTAPGLELVWAYGGVNGQRGTRDGDIGTERVPISQYFQLQPEFCRGNSFEVGTGRFQLKAKAATIAGLAPGAARLYVGDARQWNDLPALLAAESPQSPDLPVIVGRAPLAAGQPLLFSLQRLAVNTAVAADLRTYQEVSSDPKAAKRKPATLTLAPEYSAADLPVHFAETEAFFKALRTRVAVDTPDPFLNAAVGALNVAADALWDEPEHAIMHGAIAWRTKLLGWRGPYVLDELGWHDRALANATYWAGRQNTDPIPDKFPPPDERTNLARNEAGLHSNGDISNSHYDMNLVYIDAVFRHLLWTGDKEFAKKMWPVIVRHLAWERRLFRREFGPEKLPLYEAYAVIWASDNLQYDGGGTAHASAYNYYHNKWAARLAPLVGADPVPYEREAALIARGMRELLWLPERGAFAEYKDLLGRQLVHPSAAVWTFYHVVDSEVPTPAEAWQMTRQVDREIPHLPVCGPGVPAGLHTLAESNWMPYDWSVNNVVMDEAVHTALGFWQAGRPEEAWRITKGSFLATMFMGISPGNAGTMTYLDVYRREAQRDFGDSAGTLSRAIVEGLFGVRPDALAGELLLKPGFPAEWDHASLRHPDLSYSFRRNGDRDTYVVEPSFAQPQKLRLQLALVRERVAAVEVNGRPADWRVLQAAGAPTHVEIAAPAASRTEIVVAWAGAPAAPEPPPAAQDLSETPMPALPAPPAGATLSTVDLSPYFNDRVTQIFRNEYREPRSPFVSLALPKQGLGGWAGGVNARAEIDDSGLRAKAAENAGRIVLPNGVPFSTPGNPDAKNILFTSQWKNYPVEAVVPLEGHAREVYLLMAGSTTPMQSRLDNGEVIVTYRDGTTERLALENPTTWWPIERDYFIDDFQFQRPGPLPPRVDLKTGSIRMLDPVDFKGKGRDVRGGAATVLGLALRPDRELQSLTVRTLANDVVIGLMSATLLRPDAGPAPAHAWGDWPRWGDQRDGTYLNPVIPADYSDIDCIRVGSDYYAISSTFQFSPGMIILHSRDLVNWSIAGHAVADLTQIGPDLNWDRMNRYSKGVWAGAIRYHDGKFWIFFGTPDEGYFMTTAKDAAGPWEPLHPVIKGAGWDDCCPFWDDDGQGYLVGTSFREGYKIHLWKLSADGRDIVPESDRVIHQSKGSEANKLYKFNGIYYHFFSENRAEGRVIVMERAKSVFGPYAEERQLKRDDREAMEPNQGGFVDGPDGKWFFFTHHGRGNWEGRCASLLPVTWIDGWPVVGEIGPDGLGKMVWSGKMPAQAQERLIPQTSDAFGGVTLAPQWEWNYQPRADRWSLTERPGWLRLHAFRPLEPGNLMKAGNTLTQRSFRTVDSEVVVELDLSGMADGQEAGLCHFSKKYSALGVKQDAGARILLNVDNGMAKQGPAIAAQQIWLRSKWGLDGQSRYSFSLDGKTFADFGASYPLSWGNYRGDRIGIYNYNDRTDDGWVDIGHFEYRIR
jgi:beta-xylosidase